MIKNRPYLEEFEKQINMEEKIDFSRNLRIYEAMWQEAVALGIFPLNNLYDGLENDIRIARILNRMPKMKYPPELLKNV